MKELVWAVEAPKVERKIEIPYQSTETCEEDVATHGEEVVHGTFKAQEKIKFQAFVRSTLEAVTEDGKPAYNDAEVLEKAAAWKLGVSSKPKVTKAEKANRILSELSDAEIKALLAQYA